VGEKTRDATMRHTQHFVCFTKIHEGVILTQIITEVLDVPRTATEDELKKAYYKMSRKWHPDKNRDK